MATTTSGVISRITTHDLTLPNDAPRVLLQKPYARLDTNFRVVEIEESIDETNDKRRPGYGYFVKVIGPVHTTHGDHSSQKGKLLFVSHGAWGSAVLALDKLPDELKPYLLGEDALRNWKA